jgi:hypothetical protein
MKEREEWVDMCSSRNVDWHLGVTPGIGQKEGGISNQTFFELTSLFLLGIVTNPRPAVLETPPDQ